MKAHYLLPLLWVLYLPTASAESIHDFAVALSHKLHGEKLIYSANPKELRDCSGIFHRLLNNVQNLCANLPRPPVNKFRSSRAIADWYNQQGSLTLVHDALKQDALIQPGAVMFYGRSRQTHTDITVAEALRGISHIGVVTDVTRDTNNQVISYRLFHGRSGKKPASITKYHWRKPSRRGYPPFGNGSQQWIGVAGLCKDESCLCETPLPEALKNKLLPAQQKTSQIRQAIPENADGLASWYGGKFHGRKTANGETFSKHQLTAAHRNLPFGTRLKVTNLHNNQSVIVRVNDRGPFAGNNRVIDLSEAAAGRIKMKTRGIAPVRLEILGHGY